MSAGEKRPDQPDLKAAVWYRGWEISWNDDAEFWTREGWDAYKGGPDLDAPNIRSSDFTNCLDEIDDYEDGES